MDVKNFDNIEVPGFKGRWSAEESKRYNESSIYLLRSDANSSDYSKFGILVDKDLRVLVLGQGGCIADFIDILEGRRPK